MWNFIYFLTTSVIEWFTNLRFFLRYRLKDIPVDITYHIGYIFDSVTRWLKNRRIRRQIARHERREKFKEFMALFDRDRPAS